MPSTTTPGEAASPRRHAPRRRSLLAGGAVALAAGALNGCTGDNGPPDGRTARPDALRRMRRDAARDSEALLTRYTNTLAAHPALTERLAPLRDTVARHVEVLSGSPSGTRRPTGGPGTQDGTGTARKPRETAGGPRHMAVPPDEAQAVTALADAERRTADTRMRALADAPPEFARLLASVAAAGSAHTYLLTEGDAA